MVVLILVPGFASEANAANSWIDNAKQTVQRAGQTIQQDTRNIQQGVQQGFQQFQQGTQAALNQQQQVAAQLGATFQNLSAAEGQALNQSIQRISSSYNYAQTSQLIQSLPLLGQKSGQLLTQCYDKYSNQPGVAEQILWTVRNQPERFREQILTAYRDHTKEVGDKVLGCYSRLGYQTPDVAQGLASLYMQNKGELALAMDRLALAQQPGRVRSVLAYYLQNQNERLAMRLCDLQERYRDQWKNDLQNITANVILQVRDPRNQDRAIECAIVALEIYEHREEYTTVAIKTVLESIPVTTKDGEKINAEEYLKRVIVLECPYLAGTTIAEDPVRCLTYGVIYRDNDFLFNDLKVIPGPNGDVSASEALCAYVKTDPSSTVEVLDKMEAWSVLVAPDSSADDTAQAVAVLIGPGPQLASNSST